MTETLRSCPFCGSLPTVQPWHGGPTTKHLVGCERDDCAASPAVTGKTRTLAITAWNRRAEPTPETLEAWAEWFDDPGKSPSVVCKVPLWMYRDESSVATPGYLLREIARRMRANNEE
uniref:Putative restriction alleviation protein n=1 Tax=viral metagenome TaxID=1070528 RepID=A0A6M3K962_9ZZZZ